MVDYLNSELRSRNEVLGMGLSRIHANRYILGQELALSEEKCRTLESEAADAEVPVLVHSIS